MTPTPAAFDVLLLFFRVKKAFWKRVSYPRTAIFRTLKRTWCSDVLWAALLKATLRPKKATQWAAIASSRQLSGSPAVKQVSFVAQVHWKTAWIQLRPWAIAISKHWPKTRINDNKSRPIAKFIQNENQTANRGLQEESRLVPWQNIKT